jgi:hypothetical protein
MSMKRHPRNDLTVRRIVARRRRFGAALWVPLYLSGGCATIPPYVQPSKPGETVPAGPKVAALIANLKCGLWNAANSPDLLPFYQNKPNAIDDPNLRKNQEPTGSARAFSLKNIFQEIEYVGEATFQLEVTNTGAFNPSLGLSKYYSGTVGDLPATGATLAVGGTLSDAADRYVQLYTSVDFSRLVPTEPDPFIAAPYNKKSPSMTEIAADPNPCTSGLELEGDLGLREPLAMGLIANAMNDLQVLPISDPSAPRTDNPAPGGNVPIAGLTSAVSLPSTYAFGQITTQIDFTVIENINGGPTWTLQYLKLPGGSSSGLLNVNRQVKDTLTLTIIPVCIREKYWTNSESAPYEYQAGVKNKAPVKMVEGTPPWANFLPPCDNPGNLQDKVAAVRSAHQTNVLQQLLFTSPGLSGLVP